MRLRIDADDVGACRFVCRELADDVRAVMREPPSAEDACGVMGLAWGTIDGASGCMGRLWLVGRLD